MSLPEIIPSNLPQFVQNKDRTAFANSVIPSGSVLLFAESDGSGGSKLITKNPDGSFSEIGGGGSGTFYKCASVDTTNHAWTGYLASIDSTTGVWSFASTATSGLSYDRITPIVGSVYDEDCTFEVKKYKTNMPSDGLIFYLPLATEVGEFDEASGLALYHWNPGNSTFTTQNGIQCIKMFDGSSISGPDLISVFPNNNTSRFTISFWAAANMNLLRKYSGAYFWKYNDFGNNTDECQSGINVKKDSAYSRFGGGYQEFTFDTADRGVMSHFACRYDGTKGDLFYKGVLSRTISTSSPHGQQTAAYPIIGQRTNDSSCASYFTAFRIYDRALTSDEIATLAAEFTPTPLS